MSQFVCLIFNQTAPYCHCAPLYAYTLYVTTMQFSTTAAAAAATRFHWMCECVLNAMRASCCAVARWTFIFFYNRIHLFVSFVNWLAQRPPTSVSVHIIYKTAPWAKKWWARIFPLKTTHTACAGFVVFFGQKKTVGRPPPTIPSPPTPPWQFKDHALPL